MMIFLKLLVKKIRKRPGIKSTITINIVNNQGFSKGVLSR